MGQVVSATVGSEHEHGEGRRESREVFARVLAQAAVCGEGATVQHGPEISQSRHCVLMIQRGSG